LQLGSRATKTGVEVCPAVQPIFDTLKFPINNDDTLIDFQDALDQINLGEMPPEDQPQPKAKEKRAVVKWPAATIKQYQASRESTGSETVLRRLNRREHFNTVRDLFHLDTSHFDPNADFPADQETHHLNNQGSELVMSSFLLQQQLKSAQQIIKNRYRWASDQHPKHGSLMEASSKVDIWGATLLRSQLDDAIKAFRHRDEAKNLNNREIRKPAKK